MSAPALMHFLVHSAAFAFAPFAPHFESETYPLTVVASSAKETPTNMNITESDTSTSNSFLMVNISSIKRLGRNSQNPSKYLPAKEDLSEQKNCSSAELYHNLNLWL